MELRKTCHSNTANYCNLYRVSQEKMFALRCQLSVTLPSNRKSLVEKRNRGDFYSELLEPDNFIACNLHANIYLKSLIVY